MKKQLIVLQEGNKDCAAACLLSVIRYYGGDISLDRLIDITKTSKEGTNFYNISEAAKTFRLVTKCFKVEDVEKIRNINTPFIVQVTNKKYNHFIVIYKISNNKVTAMDPGVGKCILDIFDFFNMWTGYIMCFEKLGNVPLYNGDKVLNNIIYNTVLNNITAILFLIILSVIFTILSCALSLYSKIVFDKIINTNINNLIIITLVFSILFIVKNITDFIRNHLVIFLNQKLDISIMLSTYSKVILLPYFFYKNKTTSEVLSRINDLSYLKNFISKIIVLVFLDFLTFIFSFLIVFSINKEIAFVLMFMNLIYFVVIIIFNGIVKKNIILNQENNAGINNLIIESVSGFETIKGLNIEDNIIFRFSKFYSKLLNDLYYSEKVNNVIYFIKELITDGTILLINFLMFRLIMNNNLTVGDYMTMSFLFGYLIYPMRNLIDILNEWHYVKSAIKRGNHLLEYDEEKIYDKEKMLVNGNIRINNLNYTFNNKYYVLKNINLFIRDKERVLVLGESGSGKSTIMKILYKCYHVSRNMVYINDYDLNDYSMSDIRKHITYIAQNEILFNGSIRDNIILDRNVSEVEFLNICKIVGIDDIIKDNMLGYDYIIEENGSNLSGGQRQRIILARSLLKNSSVIMIDEGLNQIDIKLEREILNNIFNYFYDKTFIVISHRKENMDLYNRVIRISNGMVRDMEEVYK